MPDTPAIADAMRKYRQAFSAAAKWFNVYILVRRTNQMSLQYVGKPGFVPKRLDCKAKTADCDYVHPQYGPKMVAGLVVDSTTTGRDAFTSGRKYDSATLEWRGFAATMLDPAVLTLEGQKAVTYVPNGKFYFVDLNPASARFGCVKFTSGSLLTAGKYIHGDYDLYGIVRADDPSRNVGVTETRLGQKHVRSPEFFDVQNYVNRLLGVPMVLHGAQEGYGAEHSDEGVDVFTPDGKMFGAENKAEIARLYATTFTGRQLFTKGGLKEVVLGAYMTPG